MIRIQTPLTDKAVKELKAGMRIGIDGVLYTARDAAHQKLSELIKQKKKLPFDPGGEPDFGN